MELINQHINSSLRKLIENNEISVELFSKISNYPIKIRLKKLLVYLDFIIKIKKNENPDDINVLHIHFENDFNNEVELMLVEFIIVKLFVFYQSKEINVKDISSKNVYLSNKIEEFKKKYAILDGRCPEKASAKNGGNKIYKTWVANKVELNCLLTFYQSLHISSVFSNKALINCKVNVRKELLDTYKLNPFAIDIDNEVVELAYNFLNTEYSLNDIDYKHDFLDNMEEIVIFDCERKKIMTNFSLEEIKKWNSDGTNFKNYLIFTFGKETHSFNNIRNKIDTIRERFKIPEGTSYTILRSEIDMLLNKKEKNNIAVEFIGFQTCSFWDTFLLETSIRELYELRSIKLMNIYSICFTDEIKGYIIDDLFSKKESSELISSSTKMAILELRDEDIDSLKEALSNTLDLIINSGIKSKIIESLTSTPSIIFDEAIIKNTKLILKITDCIGLTKSIKLKTWSDLLNSTSNYFLILSYRDQGRYPNYYYPNLLEIQYHPETTAIAILPNFLFGHHYKWSKYYLLKEYHKYLAHSIRENHFEWNKLKNTIQTQKPELKLNIDWNLENEYSNSEQRETFKIKLKNQRAKIFNSSDLFIISDEKNISRKVVKIDFLMSLENEDSKVFIQNLDEIQENINIYEKIVDKTQQEAELDVIRKQFNIDDGSAGRLWKILLKNIAGKDGEEKLYNDLKNNFESKGIKIVSQFHFKNSWINPQSESIAPLSKRVFIELCEYLNIPKIYFVIIQRIRNASKQSSRQSTRQMNQLLKDLFNDGCFDNGKNAREIINNKLSYYKLNHPLDELGIDENYLADNLVTLTELIQPELNLLELETINKIEQ